MESPWCALVCVTDQPVLILVNESTRIVFTLFVVVYGVSKVSERQTGGSDAERSLVACTRPRRGPPNLNEANK